MEEGESQSSGVGSTHLVRPLLKEHNENKSMTNHCHLKETEKQNVTQNESDDLCKTVQDHLQDTSPSQPRESSEGRNEGDSPTECVGVEDKENGDHDKAVETIEHEVEGVHSVADSEDNKLDKSDNPSKNMDVGQEHESGLGSNRECVKEVTDTNSTCDREKDSSQSNQKSSSGSACTLTNNYKEQTLDIVILQGSVKSLSADAANNDSDMQSDEKIIHETEQGGTEASKAMEQKQDSHTGSENSDLDVSENRENTQNTPGNGMQGEHNNMEVVNKNTEHNIALLNKGKDSTEEDEKELQKSNKDVRTIKENNMETKTDANTHDIVDQLEHTEEIQSCPGTEESGTKDTQQHTKRGSLDNDEENTLDSSDNPLHNAEGSEEQEMDLRLMTDDEMEEETEMETEVRKEKEEEVQSEVIQEEEEEREEAEGSRIENKEQGGKRVQDKMVDNETKVCEDERREEEKEEERETDAREINAGEGGERTQKSGNQESSQLNKMEEYDIDKNKDQSNAKEGDNKPSKDTQQLSELNTNEKLHKDTLDIKVELSASDNKQTNKQTNEEQINNKDDNQSGRLNMTKNNLQNQTHKHTHGTHLEGSDAAENTSHKPNPEASGSLASKPQHSEGNKNNDKQLLDEQELEHLEQPAVILSECSDVTPGTSNSSNITLRPGGNTNKTKNSRKTEHKGTPIATQKRQNIAKKSTSKMKPRRFGSICGGDRTRQQSSTKETDSEDSSDSDIVIISETIKKKKPTNILRSRVVSSLVCNLCQMLWNDDILEAIFEGNKTVTVNSKITYGGIMCFSSYADVHYQQHKEKAVRGVLERADLGKNIGDMKTKEMVEWLSYLMRSGSATCCNVFDAVYDGRNTDEVLSALINPNKTNTQKPVSKKKSVSNGVEKMRKRNSSSSSSSSSSKTKDTPIASSKTTTNTTKRAAKSKQTKNTPAKMLPANSNVEPKNYKSTSEQNNVDLSSGSLVADSQTAYKKMLLKECSVYLGKRVTVPLPQRVCSPDSDSPASPAATNHPCRKEVGKVLPLPPREIGRVTRRRVSLQQLTDSSESNMKDKTELPTNMNSTTEMYTEFADAGSSKEPINLESELDENNANTPQIEDKLTEQLLDKDTTETTKPHEKCMTEAESIDKPKEDTCEKDPFKVKGEGCRKEKLESPDNGKNNNTVKDSNTKEVTVEGDMTDVQVETHGRNEETKETDMEDEEVEIHDKDEETNMKDLEVESHDKNEETKETDMEDEEVETHDKDEETNMKDLEVETHDKDEETNMKETEIETDMEDEVEIYDGNEKINMKETEIETHDKIKESDKEETELEGQEKENDRKETEVEMQEKESDRKETEIDGQDKENDREETEVQMQDKESDRKETEVDGQDKENDREETEVQMQDKESERKETEVQMQDKESDRKETEVQMQDKENDKEETAEIERQYEDEENDVENTEIETHDKNEETGTEDTEVETHDEGEESDNENSKLETHDEGENSDDENTELETLDKNEESDMENTELETHDESEESDNENTKLETYNEDEESDNENTELETHDESEQSDNENTKLETYNEDEDSDNENTELETYDKNEETGTEIKTQDEDEESEEGDMSIAEHTVPENQMESTDQPADNTKVQEHTDKLQRRNKNNTKCSNQKTKRKDVKDQTVTRKRGVATNASGSKTLSNRVKRSAVDSTIQSRKKQKVSSDSEKDSPPHQETQHTAEDVTDLMGGESTERRGTKRSCSIDSKESESSVSPSFDGIGSSFSDGSAPSCKSSNESDTNTNQERPVSVSPQKKKKGKVLRTPRGLKMRLKRTVSHQNIVSSSGTSSDSSNQVVMYPGDSTPHSTTCTDYKPVLPFNNTEESENILIQKLGLNVSAIELYCSTSDSKIHTNRDMANSPRDRGRPSTAMQEMIKERSHLDGVAKQAFDLLPFEPHNIIGIAKAKERYLTNQELLVLQNICVLNPEAPDMEMFYQILIQVLLARKQVLLVPNSLALLVVAERIRKEFNRAKRKGNHSEYLAQNWDASKVYTTADFYIADKKPPKMPTVRTVVSLFCLWKNLDKRVPISLPIALEELCGNLVLWDVDKIGICVKLYSRYCTFLYEEKNPSLAEFFLNQPFVGSRTQLQKQKLLNSMAGDSRVSPANPSSRCSINVTKSNDVQLLLKQALKAEQAAVISPGTNEAHFRECVQALKHKVNAYKNEIQQIQKVTKETEKKKFQLLSKFNNSQYEDLPQDLGKTTETLYRLLAKTTTKFEMLKETESMAAKHSNKVCRLSPSALKAANLGEDVSESMKELVYELLLNEVKVEDMKPVLCVIVEDITNKHSAIVPSDSWIRNFARITGLKVKPRDNGVNS